MIEMSVEFNNSGQIEVLFKLLEHPIAGPWVAFLIAELSEVSIEQKEFCINKIKSIASGSSLNSIAAEYLLKERGYNNS